MYSYDQAVEWPDHYRPSWRSQCLVHVRWIPPAKAHQTLPEDLHSDSEDDSTRPSQPSGWDGWHKRRPDGLDRPRPTPQPPVPGIKGRRMVRGPMPDRSRIMASSTSVPRSSSAGFRLALPRPREVLSRASCSWAAASPSVHDLRLRSGTSRRA